MKDYTIHELLERDIFTMAKDHPDEHAALMRFIKQYADLIGIRSKRAPGEIMNNLGEYRKLRDSIGEQWADMVQYAKSLDIIITMAQGADPPYMPQINHFLGDMADYEKLATKHERAPFLVKLLWRDREHPAEVLAGHLRNLMTRGLISFKSIDSVMEGERVTITADDPPTFALALFECWESKGFIENLSGAGKLKPHAERITATFKTGDGELSHDSLRVMRSKSGNKNAQGRFKNALVLQIQGII